MQAFSRDCAAARSSTHVELHPMVVTRLGWLLGLSLLLVSQSAISSSQPRLSTHQVFT
jgi:hypothetical protein